jgi:Cu(I)/Ag(I) efflux system membrane fusion protein
MTCARAVVVAFAIASLGGRCAQHGSHGDHPGPGTSASGSASGASSSPSGYAPITIDPSKVGPLGLSTTTVEERDFTSVVRTVGVVALDETRTAHVHTKVKGFVEALLADFVGKKVKRGETLAAIYSQAVYAAQLEYIALMKQPGLEALDPKLLEAARRRLLLWDVPPAQIERLQKTLEPQRTYVISAPRAGVLVGKQAALGNYVEPGTELFTLSDLSKLWVWIDVYEADVPNVTLGLDAKLTIEGHPAPLNAKVGFVSPMIDESTRTLKVRLELPNPDGTLRPGAFANAELSIPLGRGLAVPESAVIRTGARNIVFTVHRDANGAAHVTPHEVTLGPLVGGFFRVSGLAPGDAVATGAQFLIDSESRLGATTGAPAGGHGGH